MSLVADLAEAFLRVHLSETLDPERSFDIASLSVEDAYEVQRRVIAARVAKGEKVVGYKVGCTSRAIRHRFDVAEPICGRVMAPHVFQGNTVLNWLGIMGDTRSTGISAARPTDDPPRFAGGCKDGPKPRRGPRQQPCSRNRVLRSLELLLQTGPIARGTRADSTTPAPDVRGGKCSRWRRHSGTVVPEALGSEKVRR